MKSQPTLVRGADYRDLIEAEYLRRRGANASYSVRAFARAIGIGKTSLSDVLGRKRHLSRGSARKVAEKLCFSPDQTRRMERQIRGGGAERYDDRFLRVREDAFQAISDWQHYAILSLANLDENQAEPEWIARRLGIAIDMASGALERLTRLGLVVVRDRKLSRTTVGLTSTTDVPSAAIRKHHRQTLELAADAIESSSVERRDLGSITMAIDPEKLPEAKARLREFRRSLAEWLESGPRREVYTLSMQLFPLTKGSHP